MYGTRMDQEADELTINEIRAIYQVIHDGVRRDLADAGSQGSDNLDDGSAQIRYRDVVVPGAIGLVVTVIRRLAGLFVHKLCHRDQPTPQCALDHLVPGEQVIEELAQLFGSARSH
jgi:hypothetical protein